MSDWPEVDGLGISEHQKDQLFAATRQRIGILTGGPGTGKSHTMGAMATQLEDVAFCAPTGRAAVRLKEAMAQNSVDAPCLTVHRLLSPTRNGHDDQGWGFYYNRFNKLPFRFVIGDEWSMADSYITRCLLEACGPDTHVLLVGDPDQLPPVGKGKPLLDMIQSRQVPHGHLVETHRFAGRIATVCRDLQFGRRWESSEEIDLDAEYPENFKHVELNGDHLIIQTLKMLLAERFPLRTDNVMRDVQVIVAKNRKSELSQERLNPVLQDVLNPHGRKVEDVQFRVGDKVCCLKNGMRYIAEDDGAGGFISSNMKNYCANGEIGYCVAVSKQEVVVEFEGHGIATWFPRNQWSELRLAYALTCHKCQGGQWPFVVPVVDASQGARMVCSRSWWYTAFSRGKKMVTPIGRRSVIDADCKRIDLRERRTHLVNKLRREMI